MYTYASPAPHTSLTPPFFFERAEPERTPVNSRGKGINRELRIARQLLLCSLNQALASGSGTMALVGIVDVLFCSR